MSELTERDRRLQEIRNYLNSMVGDYYDVRLLTEHVEWLLDEVERLESLIGKPMMDQILGRSQPGGSYTVKT